MPNESTSGARDSSGDSPQTESGSRRTERLRLAASLAFNFAAKLPGILAAFVILPMVSRSLGTTLYGELLSALALGSAFTLPFGGIAAVQRRLLASAYAAGDRRRESDVAVTSVLLMAIVALVSAIVLRFAGMRGSSDPGLILVALLPIICGFCNIFDNTRASYNEHYVTAALQLVSQTLIYGGVLLWGLPDGAVVASGLTLQTPYAVASIATLVGLLWKRPYLMRGRISGISALLIPAIGVMVADGVMGVLLNLTVYFLELSRQPAMAAWLGTFARLFQSFLSPVLLIFFPLTSYLSMRWDKFSVHRRRQLHTLFVFVGFGYGAIVGGALAFAGPYYIDRMFSLGARGDRIDVIAVALFLGAIIAQRTYSMLLYAVAEARFVSFGTALVALFATTVGLLSSRWLPPMGAIDVLFTAVGVGVPVILLIGNFRYRRTLRTRHGIVPN